MKNGIIILLLFLVVTGFSQKPRHDYLGRQNPIIKQESLNAARILVDVLPNYPTNLNEIIDYVSVEVKAFCEGIPKSAVTTGDTLSAGQKNILNTADPGTEIAVEIRYKYKDPANFNHGNRPVNDMKFFVTVVPAFEAEYPGGSEQITLFINENVINKFPAGILLKFARVSVEFTVGENGQIAAAKVSKSTNDQDLAKILLDAINKMPKWKPAENARGIKVKQEFKFTIPNYGGGGC